MNATKTTFLLVLTLALQTGNAAFAQGISTSNMENPSSDRSAEVSVINLPAGTLAVLEGFKKSQNGKPAVRGKALEIATASIKGGSIHFSSKSGAGGSKAGIEIVYARESEAATAFSRLSAEKSPIGIYAVGCFKNGFVEKGKAVSRITSLKSDTELQGVKSGRFPSAFSLF